MMVSLSLSWWCEEDGMRGRGEKVMWGLYVGEILFQISSCIKLANSWHSLLITRLPELRVRVS